MEQSKLSTPVAIIIAGVIIAGAIMLVQTGKVGTKTPSSNEPEAVVQDHQEEIAPVTSADHIQGNIDDAKITIVEYSDLECPFCKVFHQTLETIMGTYHTDNQVAWVYRHFPLDRHPKAPHEAEASECAEELGGNDAFWKYITRLYSITPSNNGLDVAKLPEIAKFVGLDVTKFNTCLASGKYKSKIDSQLADGQRAGANGTPYSILVLKNKIGDSAKKLIADTNTKFLKQINQPGTPDLLFVTNDGMKVGVSGAQDGGLLKKIIDAILAGK